MVYQQICFFFLCLFRGSFPSSKPWTLYNVHSTVLYSTKQPGSAPGTLWKMPFSEGWWPSLTQHSVEFCTRFLYNVYTTIHSSYNFEVFGVCLCWCGFLNPCLVVKLAFSFNIKNITFRLTFLFKPGTVDSAVWLSSSKALYIYENIVSFPPMFLIHLRSSWDVTAQHRVKLL